MKMSVVIDNPKSWFLPFAKQLLDTLNKFGGVRLLHSPADIYVGNEVAFLLSCEKKVTPDILARSAHNIVVHASALPEGKGMSPLTWQVLEGKNTIPISLFEAKVDFDAGPVYLTDVMQFQGNELLVEMQAALGEKIVRMCEQFVSTYPAVIATAQPQSGKSTVYKRRSPADSELDPTKSIAEQFNLLRVVDNERYPAFFQWKGRKFVLKILSASEAPER